MADVEILRASGEQEKITDVRGDLLECVLREIKAELTDSVNLRDGRVMLVDDEGFAKDLPVNAKATEIYWSVCKPGTTNPIVGDVAIVLDADFA